MINKPAQVTEEQRPSWALAESYMTERDQLRDEVERLHRAAGIVGEAFQNMTDRAEKAEAELAKERARLDWLLTTGVCWRGCDTEIPKEHWVVGEDTEWLYDRAKDGRGRARIDAAMKEESK